MCGVTLFIYHCMIHEQEHVLYVTHVSLYYIYVIHVDI